jgi:hypothetical protein
VDAQGEEAVILPHDSAAARAACDAFCDVNGIRLPSYEFRSELKMVLINSYGHYVSATETIVVRAKHCKGIINNPRVWTYPGYTADLTVLGVTAHELGHHVNAVKGWRDVLRRWHSMAMGDLSEQPVGSYAKSRDAEDLAEAFKVFVTNPSLLEAIAPRRHRFFTEELKLKPVESRHWREILGESPRHIRAVENKLS